MTGCDWCENSEGWQLFNVGNARNQHEIVKCVTYVTITIITLVYYVFTTQGSEAKALGNLSYWKYSVQPDYLLIIIDVNSHSASAQWKSPHKTSPTRISKQFSKRAEKNNEEETRMTKNVDVNLIGIVKIKILRLLKHNKTQRYNQR